MSPRWRRLPPAAVRVTAADIGHGLRAAASGAPALERLREVVRARLGVRHCRVVSSGRAALAVSLLALARLSPRRRVIVPAYTSYSVPAALVRAGFGVTLCDVDPRTLDFDLDRLEALVGRDTLALVPNHLFGYPSDLEALAGIARRGGAFLVEDAAQAMGARWRGRPVGTLGDLGIFSLGRGKPLTAIDGGIIVTDSDEIEAALGRVPLEAAGGGLALDLVRAAALSMLVRPRLYRVPESLPWLEIGVSRFAPDFVVGALRPFRAGLATAMLGRLDAVTAIRRANAARHLDGRDRWEDVEPVVAVDGGEPAYLRLPVLARDAASRARLLARLEPAGLGVSAAYPACLADVESVRPHLETPVDPCEAARSVAARILTLPTHPFVTPTDTARTGDVLAAPVRMPRVAEGVWTA